MHVGGHNLQLVGARRQGQLLSKAGGAAGAGAVGSQGQIEQRGRGAAGAVQQGGVPAREWQKGALEWVGVVRCPGAEGGPGLLDHLLGRLAAVATQPLPSPHRSLGANEAVGLGGGPLEGNLAHRRADAVGASQQGRRIRQAQNNRLRLSRIATGAVHVGGGQLRGGGRALLCVGDVSVGRGARLVIRPGWHRPWAVLLAPLCTCCKEPAGCLRQRHAATCHPPPLSHTQPARTLKR